jgi:hypothetical protein
MILSESEVTELRRMLSIEPLDRLVLVSSLLRALETIEDLRADLAQVRIDAREEVTKEFDFDYDLGGETFRFRGAHTKIGASETFDFDRVWIVLRAPFTFSSTRVVRELEAGVRKSLVNGNRKELEDAVRTAMTLGSYSSEVESNRG